MNNEIIAWIYLGEMDEFWLNFFNSLYSKLVIKIEGKVPFLSSILSPVRWIIRIFFFLSFFFIKFITYFLYDIISYNISRKVLEKIKKNSDFPSWNRRFQCASKRIHSGNVENYIETEKNGWFVATNSFNKFIIKSWDTRA